VCSVAGTREMGQVPKCGKWWEGVGWWWCGCGGVQGTETSGGVWGSSCLPTPAFFSCLPQEGRGRFETQASIRLCRRRAAATHQRSHRRAYRATASPRRRCRDGSGEVGELFARATPCQAPSPATRVHYSSHARSIARSCPSSVFAPSRHHPR